MGKVYTTHSNIKAEVLIEGNKIPGVKLWPNPVGLGYNGRVVHRTKDGQQRINMAINPRSRYIVIEAPRQTKYGLAPGSSDIIGYQIVDIDGIMLPRFTGVEVKTDKDVVRPKQKNWDIMLKNSGGISGVVRKIGDLFELLKTPLKRK